MSSAEPPLGAVMRAQPAWKREILERKRAKLAGAAAAGVEETDASSGERLVVAESLGPLRENPFMRLENERRRLRGCRDARPLQQLLELYSSVPGIRTIRADNILIIESQPAACFAEGDAVPGCRRDAPSSSSSSSSSPPRRPDPLRELLSRRGAALAEIRAEQVVIYETAEPPEAAEPGTVSRLLEKFGQRPRGRRRRGGEGGGVEGAATPQSPAPTPAPTRAAPPQFTAPTRAAPPQPVPDTPPAALTPPQPVLPPPKPITSPPPIAPPQPVPSSPRAGAPQPVAPTRAVPPQPLPVPPRAATPQPVPGPPSRAVTPQPTASPRAATPLPVPGPPSRAVTVPQAAPAAPPVTTPQLQPVPAPPRPVAPQPVAAPQAPPVSPQAAPSPPAAPQPVPAAPRAVTPKPTPATPAAGPQPPAATPSVTPQPPAAPKPAAPQANCFLHKIGSNSFTVTPRGLPPGSRLPEPRAVATGHPSPPKGPPVPSASASHARANARRPKPEVAVPPSASLVPSATAPTQPPPMPTQPLSAAAPRGGGSFEILPAPKPDLAAIPAHDLQAQALAKLRLNSRNSFLFVPRQEGGTAVSRAQSARTGPSEEKTLKEPPRASVPEQEEPVASRPTPLDPLVPVTYIDDIVELESGEVSPRASSAARTGSLVDQPGGAGTELEMDFFSVPLYRPHSAPNQRGGSTFTVVPKRKPVASGLQAPTDASGRPQREEEEEEEESKAKGKAVESVDGPPVGMSHKKRYPTVNEIEVIGGYLSLERSCMSKTGSRRKKMKISFNETSLQTMFEYPSESSLAEEEEEEEAGRASETEEDKSRTFYIPRPNGTLPPSTPNSDLSSYTPKHSVKFSEWQEQKYEEIPAAEGPIPKEADSQGNQVMLTPAEKGGLSDFSSEPALYF